MREFFASLFSKARNYIKFGTWEEVGAYRSIFSSFGSNIYASALVRSCIRALAEHSSKANVKCVRREITGIVEGNKTLERIIQFQPNPYMNGKDFLYKVRTLLEIHNTVFIMINRDDRGRCIGLYPMPKASWETKEYGGELFIKFTFNNGNSVTASWKDLAVLRKDYNSYDVFGDGNEPLEEVLALLNTVNEGLGNAIKSTANLRGILKSTKAMFDPTDAKRQKDQFVADYLNLANEGGIASLDSSQEFTAISMTPQTGNYKHVEALREDVFRYFGVNDDILMSKAVGDKWAAFYEAKLEPFLLALGLELTNKIFTDREKGFGNEIIFESNRLQYADTKDKLAMVQWIDRGVMTINEYREILNLAPVDGGDVRVIRKEYAEAGKLNEIQGVSDTPLIEGEVSDDQ